LALIDERRLSYGFRRILAITFTNKAAAEMKSRVVETLDEISKNEQEALVGQLLAKELNIPYQEVKRRAELVLRQILHHYSDLSIGTIDSFTHKIVKTFAQDMQLPVNFNIEMDTEGFYEKVISSLFASVGEDDYVSHLLKDYALSKARDNASWDPEMQIKDFAKLLQKENSGQYIDQLKQFDAVQLEEFRQEFLSYIRYYESELKKESKLALDLIAKHQIQDDDFTGKSRGPHNFFKKCYELRVTLDDAEGKTLLATLASGNWQGKGSGSGNSALQSISSDLSKIAQKLIDFITQNFRYLNLCQVLSKQMYPLMLLKKIEEITEQQKQEERLVFVSEFNRRIFDIIQNEPTPFIYERLGERYQHYLLDEFQDTSSLQWQNLLPLLDSSLANGWFNLVVGDGKQSIYRWRNANVQQFAELPAVQNSEGNAVLKERADALERNFFEDYLEKNYRSAAEIIQFNNQFFTALSQEQLTARHSKIYYRHEQGTISKEQGYLSIHTGSVSRDELDQKTQALVHQHIISARQDGYALKDMCVLARTNFHGNTIADYLMAAGIPVVSSDSLLLLKNLEVNTLIAALQYLADPEDQLSAAAVLNYLHQSQQISQSDLHTALRKIAKHERLGKVLDIFQIHLQEDELSLSNLFDNCVMIISALKLHIHGYQYLRFFLDEVAEFLVLNYSSLPDFFDWWERRKNKASMVIPENTDAVKIMTIHSSKGLEFPIVIIPFCNWGIYRIQDDWVEVHHQRTALPVSVVNLSSKAQDSGFEKEVTAEQEEQCLDNLNLLYVAFTRAASRLHIISIKSSGQKKDTVSDWIEDYAEKNIKSIGEGIYESGQKTQKIEGKQKKQFASFELRPLQFEAGGNQVKIKSSYLLNSEDAEIARRQGILMHWILSAVSVPEDVATAVEAGIAKGEIALEEKDELIKKISAIVNLPELKQAFAPGNTLQIEREIVRPEGDVLRPDRFIEFADSCLLIDYKTGKENYPAHSRQLQNYQLALESMGYQNVRKLLVYIDEAQVVEVN
jgi:ATP-dependent exoDNAse (exonuclease V) beta subunit